ncbi:MAG: DUF4115 domain-containing protein [Synechococcus sp. BS307-5m-G39]|nr:DUF4115 domain-containing protein [Synechococcus sp. BS307-5m-G39]MBL6800144.1 DUF4115 domain-containing protein [Synechococcus sp. BS307-5m-G37]
MRPDESADKARHETASKLVIVGSQLRSAREAVGLSGAQLADSLHMGHEQLDALEKGERDRLPEPVFIKAMTRRVAVRLQMDADPLIHELSIAMAEEQAKGSPTTTPPTPSPLISGDKPSPARSGSNPSATIWKAAATIALLAGVGIGSALVFAKQRQISPPAVASNTTSRPPTPETPEPTVTTEPESSLIPASEAPALSITSQEPSWLEVRNANRETVYEGTLDGESPLAVNPGDEVYAGRPDLVLLSVGNNPPQPLGDITDIRWHKITPEP